MCRIGVNMSVGGTLLAKLQWFVNAGPQLQSFQSGVTLQSDGSNWIIISSDYLHTSIDGRFNTSRSVKWVFRDQFAVG